MKIDIRTTFENLKKQLKTNKEGLNTQDQKILYLLLSDTLFQTRIQDLHYWHSTIINEIQIAKIDASIWGEIENIILDTFKGRKLGLRWIKTLVYLILFHKIKPPDNIVTIGENDKLHVIISISENISSRYLNKTIKDQWKLNIETKVKKLPSSIFIKKTLDEIIKGEELINNMRIGLKGEKLIPNTYVGNSASYYKKGSSYKKQINKFGILTDDQIYDLLQKRINKELNR